MSGALLTPLRHPLIVAKELATLDLLSEGRLIAMPTVSWQREEYEALGVPFEARGAILDEQLEIWHRLWTVGSPVSADGEHFRFPAVFIEPPPHRVGGPELWIGGLTFAPWAIRRVSCGTAKATSLSSRRLTISSRCWATRSLPRAARSPNSSSARSYSARRSRTRRSTRPRRGTRPGARTRGPRLHDTGAQALPVHRRLGRLGRPLPVGSAKARRGGWTAPARSSAKRHEQRPDRLDVGRVPRSSDDGP